MGLKVPPPSAQAGMDHKPPSLSPASHQTVVSLFLLITPKRCPQVPASGRDLGFCWSMLIQKICGLCAGDEEKEAACCFQHVPQEVTLSVPAVPRSPSHTALAEQRGQGRCLWLFEHQKQTYESHEEPALSHTTTSPQIMLFLLTQHLTV